MKNRLPLSRHGTAFTGGAVAVSACGLLVGDGVLFLLGLSGLLLLVVAWLVGRLGLRAVEVEMYLPQRVRAGVPFELELTIHNRRALFDAFNIQVEVNLPGRVILSALANWTPAGAGARMVEMVVLPSRGYVESHPVVVSTTFPLGLFHLKRFVIIHHEITVTPRVIYPQELNSDGALHDSQPRGGVTVGQSFGEPRGIRPWQAGDAARRIHWPASARSLARGHELRVREYDPPGFHPDHCHLVFHSYASGGEMLREDRFERAISLLAGALSRLQSNGIPCDFTADFNDWQDVHCGSRAQLIECLSQLSRVKRCRGTEAHDLENVLQSVPSNHALVIVSDMAPDSWSHLLSKHPHTMIIDIRQIRYRQRLLRAS